ncbi:MAG: NAD(P)H-binding protein [Salinibacter sp.]
MPPSILVFGAADPVGSALFRELSHRQVPVWAFVDDQTQTEAIQGPLVSLIAGDLQDPASLDAALHGIDRVFVLSPAGPDQVVLEGNVVEAIQRTRRPIHIVKVSALGTGPEAPIPLARGHAVTEAQIRNAGLPATLLRPHALMQHLLTSSDTIRSDGLLFGAFGDVAVPFVDARDVAAVAADVLTRGGHDGHFYTITGPQALSYTQVAATLSSVLRTSVRYVDLPVERYHETLVGTGHPTWWADNLTALARWLQYDTASTVSSAVVEVTGRPARTLEQFIRDHRAAFTTTVARS